MGTVGVDLSKVGYIGRSRAVAVANWLALDHEVVRGS